MVALTQPDLIFNLFFKDKDMAEEIIDKLIDHGTKINNFHIDTIKKEVELIKELKSMSNSPSLNVTPNDIVGAISNPVGFALGKAAGILLPRLRERVTPSLPTLPKTALALDQVYQKLSEIRDLCSKDQHFEIDDLAFDAMAIILEAKE